MSIMECIFRYHAQMMQKMKRNNAQPRRIDERHHDDDEDHLEWDEMFIAMVMVMADDHNRTNSTTKAKAAMVLDPLRIVMGTGCHDENNHNQTDKHSAILAVEKAQHVQRTPHFVYLLNSPCLECAKYLTENGIKVIIFHKHGDCHDSVDELDDVKLFLESNGVLLRKFTSERRQIVINFTNSN